MPELDLEVVRHALLVARRNGFNEVEIKTEGGSFSATLLASAVAPTPTTPVGDPVPVLATIIAPLVGFYREAKTPLAVGQQVSVGDVVAVIAALGIANDVESKVSGEVVEVLVEPKQAVQYGQVLAKVRPL